MVQPGVEYENFFYRGLQSVSEEGGDIRVQRKIGSSVADLTYEEPIGSVVVVELKILPPSGSLHFANLAQLVGVAAQMEQLLDGRKVVAVLVTDRALPAKIEEMASALRVVPLVLALDATTEEFRRLRLRLSALARGVPSP